MDILENRDAWEATFRAGWLAHFESTGKIDWSLYNRPNNKTAPAGDPVDLSQSRLMLVSSAGGYLRDEQEPFDAPHPLGDYSIRTFSAETPFEAIAYAHTHYNHDAVNADPQVLMPLQHLAQLVDEGVIGELAPVANFMGYQPDISRVVDETAPAIVEFAKAEQVRAALLVPA